MSKSNTEIAAEVFGSGWSEQSDAVRGEWETFAAACRSGDADFKDARYMQVCRVLGLSAIECDKYAPSGEDAVIVGVADSVEPDSVEGEMEVISIEPFHGDVEVAAAAVGQDVSVGNTDAE